MDSDTFDAKMREAEYFHALRCPPSAWVVLRLDGHGFTKFSAKVGFERPFDLKFQEYMRQTASVLIRDLQGLYVFTESDEISIVFKRGWDLYDREVEKLVSLSAGIASATFSLACQHPAYFDSRIWLGEDVAQVVDYFRWRQEDAARCALNGWCHWSLLHEGKTPAQAMEVLSGRSLAFKTDLLSQSGIDFSSIPAWQRYGTGMCWETYEKIGYDPKNERATVTQRRQLKMVEDLPIKDAYGEFILALLCTDN